MNNKFHNYSMTKYFGLKVDAGFAIVSAGIVQPTGKDAGLAESIFWNNLDASESQSSESGRKW